MPAAAIPLAQALSHSSRCTRVCRIPLTRHVRSRTALAAGVSTNAGALLPMLLLGAQSPDCRKA